MRPGQVERRTHDYKRHGTTTLFAALASHYLFEPCFCRPGEGHDKGGVEARGKALRRQALVPIPSAPTLAAINAALLARMDARLERRPIRSREPHR
jgi:transposase